jgi:hypothetical protein
MAQDGADTLVRSLSGVDNLDSRLPFLGPITNYASFFLTFSMLVGCVRHPGDRSGGSRRACGVWARGACS